MDKITASDYAKVTGCSVQWICRLCRDGRIDGAVKDGNTWLIDPMAQLPVSKFVERRIAKDALLQAVRAKRMEAVGVTARVMDFDAVRGQIDKWVEAGAVIDKDGSVSMDGNAVDRIAPYGDRSHRYYLGTI